MNIDSAPRREYSTMINEESKAREKKKEKIGLVYLVVFQLKFVLLELPSNILYYISISIISISIILVLV